MSRRQGLTQWHEFLNTLVSEVASRGKTIFFSSHILSEVEAVADWVAIIHSGKLVLCDQLDHLKQAKKVVKLTYVDLPPATEIETLRRLPDVMNLAQEGRSVRLLTHGNVDLLEQSLKARTYAIREIEMVDLNLEDLFPAATTSMYGGIGLPRMARRSWSSWQSS